MPEDKRRPALRIHFVPLRKVLNLFPGEFPSLFKGEGLDFVGLRPHQQGDDLDRIHWPSLAKIGSLLVKDAAAEKSLTCLVALDVSPSMKFGRKQEMVELFLQTLIAPLIMRGSNFLGLLLLAEKVESYLAPQFGKRVFLEIQNRHNNYRPEETTTNIPLAIDFINRRLRSRSVVFFVSDFLGKRDFAKQLRVASHRFDFIPVVVQDPSEFVFPAGFRVSFKAMESSLKKRSVCLSESSSANLAKDFREIRERTLNLFSDFNLDSIILEPSQGIRPIRNFLYKRSLKKK